VRERITQVADRWMRARTEKFGAAGIRHMQRMIVLHALDQLWREHLVTLGNLRRAIGWRGYARRQPLTEYRTEAFHLFESMLGAWPRRLRRCPCGWGSSLPGVATSPAIVRPGADRAYLVGKAQAGGNLAAATENTDAETVGRRHLRFPRAAACSGRGGGGICWQGTVALWPTRGTAVVLRG
jgi:hypothetical protein